MSEQPDVKFTIRVRTCWQHQDETFDGMCLYCLIAELEAELSNVKALLDAATREGVLAESLADTERAEAALREVRQLEDELRNTFTPLPDLTRANPDRVDRYVRDLIAGELRKILAKHHG